MRCVSRLALLEKLLPGLDGDFYLCGPTGFMPSVQEDLEARGVTHPKRDLLTGAQRIMNSG